MNLSSNFITYKFNSFADLNSLLNNLRLFKQCREIPEYLEINLIWPLSFHIFKHFNQYKAQFQKSCPSNQDVLSRFIIDFFTVNFPKECVKFYKYRSSLFDIYGGSIDEIYQDPELASLMNYFWPNLVPSIFTNNSVFWNDQLAIDIAKRDIHMASGEAMYYFQLTTQDYERQNIDPYSFKKSLESLNNDIRIRIHYIEGLGGDDDDDVELFNNRIYSVTFCYERKREINGMNKIYAVNCLEHESPNWE